MILKMAAKEIATVFFVIKMMKFKVARVNVIWIVIERERTFTVLTMIQMVVNVTMMI